MPGPDYRLGIDVGGTNTDAVIMDRRRPGRRQGQGAVHARHHRRDHQGDRQRPARARGGPAADQPRHARHHPRHQRGAGAPEPAAGGGDQDRRPGHPQRPADVRVAARPRRHHLGRDDDRGRRHRVRRPRPVPAGHRRHRPVSRPGRRRRRGHRHHQRVRPGLAAARTAGGRDRQAGTRRDPCLAEPRDRLDRPAGAGERHHTQRGAGRGRPRRGRSDAGRAGRAPSAADQVLRAERRHADGPRPCAAVPRAHDRQRAGQQRPRGRVPHRELRLARDRRRRHVHRRRRAGQRLPAGVVAGSGDRRHPDQLPDARPGHDRARRRQRHLQRPAGRPDRAAQRRLPARAGRPWSSAGPRPP